MNASDETPTDPNGDRKSGLLRKAAAAAGRAYEEGKRILLLVTVLTAAVAIIGLLYVIYDRKDSVRNFSLDSNGLKVDFADKAADPKATSPEAKTAPIVAVVPPVEIVPPVAPTAPIAPPVLPTTIPVAPAAVSAASPVIVVLDRSLGWTAPETFAVVRHAVSEFVDGLPADVPVDVLSLNANPVWMPSANRKDLVRRIDGQFPMGRQDLREGIKAAFAKAADGTRIVVVTSGGELTGRTTAEELAKAVPQASKRVRLDVVVCGTIPDGLLEELKGLSGRTGGSVRACRLEGVAKALDR